MNIKYKKVIKMIVNLSLLMIAGTLVLGQACGRFDNPENNSDIDNTGDGKNRIANGYRVSNDSNFSSGVVFIDVQFGTSAQSCTGVFIDDQTIISSASCFVDRYGRHAEAKKISVYLGNGEKKINLGKANSLVIHENFDPVNLSSDLALLGISPIQGTEFKIFRNIASVQESRLEQGFKLTAVGFGTNLSGGNLKDNLFMSTDISFQKYEPEEISYLYPNGKGRCLSVLDPAQELGKKTSSNKFSTREWIENKDKKHCLTSDNLTGICSGDRGAPIFISSGKNANDYALLGMASRSFGAFETPSKQLCASAGLHTAVGDYKAWIDSNKSYVQSQNLKNNIPLRTGEFFNRTCELDKIKQDFTTNSTIENKVRYGYCLILGRNAEPFNGYINHLKSGQLNTMQFLTKLYLSQEFHNSFIDDDIRDHNRAFLGLMYVLLLNRASDPEGLKYWINQMNTGIITRLGVFQSFVLSDEFRREHSPLN